jgi:replicative DNA helicase
MESEIVRNEMALLGSVLLDGERCMPLAVNAGCCEEWFTDGRCVTVWLAMRKLWDEKSHAGMDTRTILDAVSRLIGRGKDGKAVAVGSGSRQIERAEIDPLFVQQLIDDTPTAAHAEYYIPMVANQKVVRKGKRLAQDFMASLPAGPALAIQNFQREIVELMAEAEGKQTAGLNVICDQVMARFEEAHRIRMVDKRMDYCPGIPLPWRYMTLTYNGLQPGLHIIGARPSVGKTAFVLNLLRYWCEHLKLTVAFNSLDMELKNMVSRPFSEVSRVSLPKASFGTTSGHDMERLRETCGRIKSWPLQLTVKRDLESFRSWCVMQKVKHDAKIIIVDFLQLLTFKDCYKMSVDDRVSHISGTLKAIGNDLDVPMVALSQLNRQCEQDGGREPTVSDLRGSGALEQDAFTVMLLHQDLKVAETFKLCPPVWLTPFGATKEANEYLAKELRPVWAILAKNQNGKTRKIPMVLYPNYFLFMMADYNAETEKIMKGEGEKAKCVGEDHAPQFGRVHPDWRGEKMEQALAKSGGLVQDYKDGE